MKISLTLVSFILFALFACKKDSFSTTEGRVSFYLDGKTYILTAGSKSIKNLQSSDLNIKTLLISNENNFITIDISIVSINNEIGQTEYKLHPFCENVTSVDKWSNLAITYYTDDINFSGKFRQYSAEKVSFLDVASCDSLGKVVITEMNNSTHRLNGTFWGYILDPATNDLKKISNGVLTNIKYQQD